MEDYKPDKQNPNRSSVFDVLAHFGKDIRLNRSGFMRSPFRDESTPSFHVTTNGRGWKDFGDGSGGGVIDLVMRLSGKDRIGAIRVLNEIENSCLQYTCTEQNFQRQTYRKKSQFEIYYLGPMRSGTLLAYSQSRGISDEVMRKYCLEMTVILPGQGSRLRSYIGFPNNAGGYVLRCEKPAGNGKRCTSSAPTFIDAQGRFSTSPSCDSVAVFEGFFDYLSYIQLYHPVTLAPGCDICVLNSVTNQVKASHFLLSHNQVFLYLDNDPAGRRTSETIILESSSDGQSRMVIDQSESYNGFKDFNDFLIEKLKSGRS